MENYNEQIREKIVRDIEDIIVNKNISLKEAILEYQKTIYKLIDSDNKYIKVIVTYIIGLSYIDSYKYYAYKQKSSINKRLEEDTFYYIYDIKDNDDLYAKINHNPDMFCKMLEAVYITNESSILSKILLEKTLTEEENIKLNHIFSLHKLDSDSIKNINLNTLINSIKDERNFQHQIMTIDFEEGIILETIGFMTKMFEIDEKTTIKLIVEMCIKDYEINKSLVKNNQNDQIKRHIEVYELMTRDEIINFIKNNYIFKYEIIKNIIDYMIINKLEIDNKSNEYITKKLTML